jgi:hypothetical protein
LAQHKESLLLKTFCVIVSAGRIFLQLVAQR